jgi:hypothetical protein
MGLELRFDLYCHLYCARTAVRFAGNHKSFTEVPGGGGVLLVHVWLPKPHNMDAPVVITLTRYAVCVLQFLTARTE